ncbi:GPW/gp25 family protein [Methylobacterium hispanicum]|uniref:GPW/gp25 family protein n=1 Tax=Methylobacterium hispanicum TaxID=270350 RepID=UPI002F2D18F0
MTDIDRRTGRVITGWPEVEQSLQVILTTEVGERVMRRSFGSRSGTLLDRPGNAVTILDHYVAIAEAIEPHVVNGRQYGEPRFDLARVIPSGDESGQFTFELVGLYYPRGHLGDFSTFEAARAVVALTEEATATA